MADNQKTREFEAPWFFDLTLWGSIKFPLRFSVLGTPSSANRWFAGWLKAKTWRFCPTLRSWTKRKKPAIMGLPALSWFQSQSYPTPEAIPAGFFILNTDETVRYQPLRQGFRLIQASWGFRPLRRATKAPPWTCRGLFRKAPWTRNLFNPP